MKADRHTDDADRTKERSVRDERRIARAALHEADGMRSDALEDEAFDRLLDVVEPVNGRSMHSSNHHTKQAHHFKGQLERTARGGEKVWKMPFWKRRKAERRRRSS